MKRYTNMGFLAIIRRAFLPLLCAVMMTGLVGIGVVKARKAMAAVEDASAGPGFSGSRPRLEVLERRFYLASEEERSPVLDEMRKLGTDDALDFTMDLLRYPDIKVRREAVDALKKWGPEGYKAVFGGMTDPEIDWLCETVFVELGPAALPFLIDQLGHSRPDHRGRAAYLLGKIKDRRATGPLYSRLKDPDRDVRIQVVQALCEQGDERSLEGILDLFESEDAGLADFVIKAAEKFGPRAVPTLRAALKKGSVKIRSGAALAIGRIRLPGALPSLFDALEDPDAGVRRSVVKALDSYHNVSTARGLFLALHDPDLEVQDYATTALARLYPGISQALMERIRDEDPGIRKNVIAAFRKAGDKEAVPLIIRALDDPDPDVRMFAVTALIELKDPRSIQSLIARMKIEDTMGWLVSYALMELGEVAVEALLKETGDDSFCLTRNLVILQMGERALGALHERARNGEGTAVRYNAIALLGELGSPESVTVLEELLRYEEVGWVAANALGNVGEPAWEALSSAAAREGVAGDNARHAISRLCDPKLYLEFVEALDSDHAGFRRAVAEPLVAAGGAVVPLVVEKMAQLEGPQFSDAVEIICRIQDQKAVPAISRALFPENRELSFLRTEQLQQLRQ
ncbi:MAG: HEAT repeat domain-containing protein [bacterium]|nr:MAG: HEAT repeat domain-containing protein [bacterium]